MYNASVAYRLYPQGFTRILWIPVQRKQQVRLVVQIAIVFGCSTGFSSTMPFLAQHITHFLAGQHDQVVLDSSARTEASKHVNVDIFHFFHGAACFLVSPSTT